MSARFRATAARSLYPGETGRVRTCSYRRVIGPFRRFFGIFSGRLQDVRSHARDCRGLLSALLGSGPGRAVKKAPGRFLNAEPNGMGTRGHTEQRNAKTLRAANRGYGYLFQNDPLEPLHYQVRLETVRQRRTDHVRHALRRLHDRRRNVPYGLSVVPLVFLPLACGYLLSYVFRTINGSIADELVHGFSLDAGSLGLLTSVYFLAFAVSAIPIGVAAESDIDLVTQTLLKAAEGVDNVLKDPAPKVQFLKFGDWSLDFRLLVWSNRPRLHMQIRSDINYRIDKLFREAKIEIPYPQTELRVRQGSLQIDTDDTVNLHESHADVPADS